jgi:hypothetical protein
MGVPAVPDRPIADIPGAYREYDRIGPSGGDLEGMPPRRAASGVRPGAARGSSDALPAASGCRIPARPAAPPD